MTGGVGRHLAVTAVGAVAERTGNVVTVATSQTTTSTTFVDLATVGPAVSVTAGVRALVSIACFMSNGTAGFGGRMGAAVSGATTSAVSDINSYYAESGNAGDGFKGSWTTLYDPITAGSSTWTAKYRAVGGGTVTFSDRVISVIPF